MTRMLSLRPSLFALMLGVASLGVGVGESRAQWGDFFGQVLGGLPNGADGPLTAEQAGAAVDEGYSGLLQVVPAIEWTTPEAIEDAWSRVKAISDPVLQAKAVDAERLYRKACRGLVDMRALQVRSEGSLKLAFRDDHRGRSWLQPHVAHVIEGALERFGKRYRRRKNKPMIMLGDATQPGCGQLEYGAAVLMVLDTPERRAATALLNRAVLRYGVPTVTETLVDAEGKPSGVRSETLIVGHAFDQNQRLTLRTVRRRYSLGTAPEEGRTERVMGTAQKLLESPVASTRRVGNTSSVTGAIRTRWVTHYVGRYKQMVAVTRKPLDPAKPLLEQLELVTELRLSKRVHRKPLSFKGEVRWVRAKLNAKTAPTGWKRLVLVHEAGHQTHIAGRDADIGFVTEDNEHCFTVAPDKVDIPKTWSWFESLDWAARRSGTSLERIIVGPKMHRLFKKSLALKKLDSRLFKQVLKVVGGHDGHHHIRVAPVATVDAPIAQRLLRPWSLIYAELFER